MTIRPPKFLIALLAFVALAFAGCGTTPQERLTNLNTYVDYYAAQSEAAEGDAENLRATLAELKAIQAQAEAAGDEGTVTRVLGEIVGINEKIGEALETKATADSVVANLNRQVDAVLAGGDITIDKELDVYAGGLRDVSGALPSPFNYIGYGLAGLLTLSGEMVRRRKNKTIKQVASGVGDLLADIENVNNAEAAKAVLKARQDPTTRKQVDALRVQ